MSPPSDKVDPIRIAWLDKMLVDLLGEKYDTPDPSPYCQYCGAMTKERCDCGPIVDHN